MGGGEAVFEGVEGGLGFSFLGFGASGFLGVEAVGGEFGLGDHKSLLQKDGGASPTATQGREMEKGWMVGGAHPAKSLSSPSLAQGPHVR